MNTEQLKTDPSNTEAKLLEIKNQIAFENGIASWYDINIYSRANFVNDVAFRFASQESKIAVEKDRESRWISVDDQEPEIGIDVFVCLNDGIILMGRLLHNGWVAYFLDGREPVEERAVTHWQPLPEAPKTLTPMKETEQTLLNQIKDQVAKEMQDKDFWIDRKHFNEEMKQSAAIEKFWLDVCERYAEAKAKASCEATLKKASEQAMFNLVNGANPNGLNAKSYTSASVSVSIDLSSINNPSNIVIV